MIDTCDTITSIETLPPPSLEQLERQTIALLYAIWRAQGKSKRVVEVRQDKSGFVGVDNSGGR